MSEKKEWYKHKKQASRQTREKIIINGTEIITGNDPRDGFTNKIARSFDAWINVSDTPCNSLSSLPWKCERYWFPVAEIHRWTYHHLFWIINVLDSCIEREDIKRVYIHCHAGARRSPFSVVLWLVAKYGIKEAVKISILPDRRKDKKMWREYFTRHLTKGGIYGEIMPELELFCKLIHLNPTYSLESILMNFERLTLGKYHKFTGYPDGLIERGKKIKHKYRDNRASWKRKLKYTKYLKVDKNNVCTYEKNENMETHSGLSQAHYFWKKHGDKCSFSQEWFYGWYGTQILKKSSWISPFIRIKSNGKTISKRSIEVLEEKYYLDNYFKFPKPNVTFKNDTISIK